MMQNYSPNQFIKEAGSLSIDPHFHNNDMNLKQQNKTTTDSNDSLKMKIQHRRKYIKPKNFQNSGLSSSQ